MNANAAIDFTAEAFALHAQSPMGRQAAGEGFLNGFIRHSGVSRFVGHAEAEAESTVFIDRIHEVDPAAEAICGSPRRLEAVEAEGLLFCYHPILAEHAWRRRARGAARYSLCGLTHTMSSHRVITAATDLLTAPIHPWDALICPSRAVRGVVEALLERQRDYLKERFGPIAVEAPQLPVIPLGVDGAAFEAAPGFREAARARFQAGPEDVVVLYVGRLSAHAKANPLPMFMALEQAAKASGKRVHLLLVGWFAAAPQAQIYQQGAARLAPSITTRIVDGRLAEGRANAWAAADIFLQLADSVQESFGLAPVEAMAAGLPLVVSDWDGFRDTVEDGVQGFRVPTLQPRAGEGGDLALNYDLGLYDYDQFLAAASMFTAVDVAAAADALARLIDDPGLRRRMGEAGRARVRQLYDWRVVIKAYQALWEELADRRAAATAELHRPHPAWRPDRPDPFDVFAGFPTRALAGTDLVRPARLSDLAERRAIPGAAMMGSLLPINAEIEPLLARLAQGPATVAELVGLLPEPHRASGGRVIAWLAKMDFAAVAPEGGAR